MGLGGGMHLLFDFMAVVFITALWMDVRPKAAYSRLLSSAVCSWAGMFVYLGLAGVTVIGLCLGGVVRSLLQGIGILESKGKKE